MTLSEYDKYFGFYNENTITLINKMITNAIGLSKFKEAEELSRRLVQIYECILF